MHEFINDITGRSIRQDEICDFLNIYYANIGRANVAHTIPIPNWHIRDEGYVFEYVTLNEI